MKKTFAVLLAGMLFLSLSGQEKPVKTGWKFGGALPDVTLSSDLGFQYGALFELYNYGDGSRYPDYFDHTYTEVSRFTKGSGIYRFMYESNHIIPGVHLTSDLSYLPDKATDFYGFNGYEAVFNKAWMDDADAAYKSRMFYRIERNQFRFKNDFQGKLSGDKLKWSAGFAFNKFEVNNVNIDKLNKGKDENLLPAVSSQTSLFEKYKMLGIIPADQANGGWVNTLKAGIAFDTRDNRPNPMKGIWTEMGIEVAPGFMGNDWGFSKFFITHRQYFTIVPEDLALVYRVGFQTNLTGNAPFFYQSQVITSMLTGATSEGLGGSSTLRGVLRNRVIGDGFVMGNVELRWKPLYFKFLKQDCYLGLDAFYDFGMVTKKIELPASIIADFNDTFPVENASDYFNLGNEKLHQCVGISIMPVINRNFVVAIDIGKALNVQDGNIGFSMGLNYLF